MIATLQQYSTITLLTLLTILGVSSLYSCESSKTDPKVTQRYDQVMEYHDEIMPLMSKTSKLRRQIKNHNHGDADGIIDALNNADDYMMEWMKDYKIPKDVPVAAQLSFIDDMEQKAKMMQTMFDNSIAKAEAYVNNHKH